MIMHIYQYICDEYILLNILQIHDNTNNLCSNRVSSWSETLQSNSWVPKDHFWKSRPKFLFLCVKFDTTMPYMVNIVQLMIP